MHCCWVQGIFLIFLSVKQILHKYVGGPWCQVNQCVIIVFAEACSLHIFNWVQWRQKCYWVPPRSTHYPSGLQCQKLSNWDHWLYWQQYLEPPLGGTSIVVRTQGKLQINILLIVCNSFTKLSGRGEEPRTPPCGFPKWIDTLLFEQFSQRMKQRLVTHTVQVSHKWEPHLLSLGRWWDGRYEGRYLRLFLTGSSKISWGLSTPWSHSSTELGEMQKQQPNTIVGSGCHV